jgi:hypothetical protein
MKIGGLSLLIYHINKIDTHVDKLNNKLLNIYFKKFNLAYVSLKNHHLLSTGSSLGQLSFG